MPCKQSRGSSAVGIVQLPILKGLGAAVFAFEVQKENFKTWMKSWKDQRKKDIHHQQVSMDQSLKKRQAALNAIFQHLELTLCFDFAFVSFMLLSWQTWKILRFRKGSEDAFHFFSMTTFSQFAFFTSDSGSSLCWKLQLLNYLLIKTRIKAID